jgi:hypothetical protein
MSEIKLPEGIKHGDILKIEIENIIPNMWNPNTMDQEDFDLLQDNMEKVGFLDPILIAPLEYDEEGKIIWQIIDGEHRFEQQRIMGAEDINCVVADPEIFDDKTRKLQTVRMNKIRGHLDIGKFNTLVNELVQNHEVPFDDIAMELGFSDEDEFQALVGEFRKSVPKKAKQEYDKAVKSVTSVDDLYKLVERLWKKYGDSLPHNWMILDFGHKRNIWIRMQSSSIQLFTEKFRQVMAQDVTIDSLLYQILCNIDLDQFILTHRDKLERKPEGGPTSIEEVLADGEGDEM